MEKLKNSRSSPNATAILPTPQADPKPTNHSSPTGWKTIESKDFGFQISYPPQFNMLASPPEGDGNFATGWNAGFSEDFTEQEPSISNPLNNVYIEITTTNYVPKPNSLEEIEKLFRQGCDKPDPYSKNKTFNRTIINNEPALAFTSQEQGTDTASFTEENYYFYKNGLVYRIEVVYSDPTYKPNFEKMVQSFYFTTDPMLGTGPKKQLQEYQTYWQNVDLRLTGCNTCDLMVTLKDKKYVFPINAKSYEPNESLPKTVIYNCFNIFQYGFYDSANKNISIDLSQST